MSTLKRSRVVFIGFLGLIFALSVTSLSPTPTQGKNEEDFEVWWAVDQGVGPGTLYIFDGEDMDERAASAVPEVYDLSANVTRSAGAARRSSPSGDLHFTKPERERCLSAPGSL